MHLLQAEDIRLAVAQAGIRGVKKRKLLKCLATIQKDKVAQEKSISYLLPDVANDIRNQIKPQ